MDDRTTPIPPDPAAAAPILPAAGAPARATPAPSHNLDHGGRRIIVGVMLAMFLSALDQTIVATALPTIGRELGDVETCPGW